uniref:Uncharacterized protein n=1 Tax=Medicago truncatula TaxID=3880 RepID=Q2HRT2_MEDTR|nr:hypothetical protein MtrDRAFT_AC157894g13v2 [Medicago truncatula]
MGQEYEHSFSPFIYVKNKEHEDTQKNQLNESDKEFLKNETKSIFLEQPKSETPTTTARTKQVKNADDGGHGGDYAPKPPHTLQS